MEEGGRGLGVRMSEIDKIIFALTVICVENYVCVWKFYFSDDGEYNLLTVLEETSTVRIEM